MTNTQHDKLARPASITDAFLQRLVARVPSTSSPS